MRPKYFFVSLIAGVLIALLGAGLLYKAYRTHQREQANKKIVIAETVKATFIEGWTTNDMAKYLEKQNLIKAKDFLGAVNAYNFGDYPLLSSKKISSKSGLEGFLFPDTYNFTKTSTAEEIIGKMLDNFTERFNSVTGSKYKGDEFITIPGYENLSADNNTHKGLSIYKIMTMASIIEKESGGQGLSEAELNDQRATVAGIFYNRLMKGQGLESDATVNYATGKSTPSATLKDLEIDSPYNTYKYAGLPPGPICNPSLASIKAALFPKKTDYYYFLHVQPSGQILYSKTFEEHVQKKNQNR